MTRRQFVYNVYMEYDRYDRYSLGIADSLPVAKRLAQSDYTSRELPDVAPTLKYDRRVSALSSVNNRIYWVAPVTTKYGSGHEYRIYRTPIVTLKDVP